MSSRRQASTSTRVGAQLQQEGPVAFAKSRNDLMAVIETKGAELQRAG